jgi:hypothetical protein
MKEKTRATIFWLLLAVGFVYLCVKCNKHEYEEIHSPHIEEDGSVLKIERK